MAEHRFLVTGCAGFIGGHMVDLLLSKGYPVVGVDNFSTGKRDTIARFAGNFDFVEGDLADASVAKQAVKGVTHIIHLASVPSVPRSIVDPLENMHSSVTSTVTLLEAAAAAGVQRVVQSSSSAVYGDSEELPKVESMLPQTLSPYAAAKMAQEYYGMAFCASRDLDCAAMRYFNVFGPRQDPNSEYAAVIPKFITLMMAGRRPTIFGDGRQSRDFIYVGDVVAGNLMAALHPQPLRGEVFNLACGVRTDLLQLIERINAVLGTNLEPVHAPARAGEVLHSVADVGKASRILGFAPDVDLGEGLAKTVDFFRGES